MRRVMLHLTTAALAVAQRVPAQPGAGAGNHLSFHII
jgi:hypothetical protein